MRSLPEVKQCCCCCSLETGSKIIAWLQIIGGVLVLITAFVVAVGGGDESHEDLSGNSAGSSFVGGILSIIFGAVLMKGIQNRRPDYINAWVIIYLVGIVSSTVGMIVIVLMTIFAGFFFFGVAVLVMFGIYLAFAVYIVVVVSSFRKEIVAAANTGV